ncbi:hypothetical protein AB4144_45255, partial [Rhizobiaceae sp. 2RAB30]
SRQAAWKRDAQSRRGQCGGTALDRWAAGQGRPCGSYLVGEGGPEIFTADRSGHVWNAVASAG